MGQTSKPTQVTFGVGPFSGIRWTSEPYDDENPNVLAWALNGYLPDPESGCALYSRPGFANPISLTVSSGEVQAVHTHTGLDGVSYNFFAANGKLWRWSTNLSSAATDVTPTGFDFPTTGKVYFRSLGDVMAVNDNVNLPWIASSLGSSPVVGTQIVYEEGATLLSRGSTDTSVASAAFRYIQAGTSATQAAITAGTALAAGTIPQDKYGIYRVSRAVGGTITVTAGASNFTSGYDTEAGAIASVPVVPTNHWDMGYFVVLTEVGATFIGNTDALAGGSSGNPASATTYYPASSLAWQAYGQPEVYTGAMFFILATVDGAAVRSSIAWSEPNEVDVGYRQTDYDNVWELTQTGSAPLFRLVGTNDGLYYFRALSIGFLSGAPNINFQNTATHDVVSENVGTVVPNAVARFGDYVYFLDTQCRPYRFRVGGALENIWTQMRQWFDEQAPGDNPALATNATGPWCVVEPNLNVVLFGTGQASVFTPYGNLTAFRRPNVFDAKTGIYLGQWGLPSDPTLTVGGIVQGTGTNTQRLCVVTSAGAVWYMDATMTRWTDGTSTNIPVFAQTPWLGYSESSEVRFSDVKVLALGIPYAYVTPFTLNQLDVSVQTTQTIETGLATRRTPTTDLVTSVAFPARFLMQTSVTQMGRGGQVIVRLGTKTSATLGESGQVQVMRIEATGTEQMVTQEDR